MPRGARPRPTRPPSPSRRRDRRAVGLRQVQRRRAGWPSGSACATSTPARCTARSPGGCWRAASTSADTGRVAAAGPRAAARARHRPRRPARLRRRQRRQPTRSASRDISAAVSAVATNLEVRDELVRRQREIAADGRHRGRGPRHHHRGRARRRRAGAAHRLRGGPARAARARGARQRRRGAIEATRDHGGRPRRRRTRPSPTFTEAADGVTVVDSSHLTLEETVEAVLGAGRRARRRRS